MSEETAYEAPMIATLGSIEELTLGENGPIMDGINENMPSQSN